MRFLILALSGVALLFAYLPAYAETCAPGALGTSRILEVDPSMGHFFEGKEKALGLQDGEVILTFDDGPMRRTTVPILDTLARECVKATFFSVGRMLAGYPSLAKRIVREGHTLAHHTHGHERLTEHSLAKARKIVRRTQAKVEKVAFENHGQRHKMPFFRYPYLAHNKALDQMIASQGLIAFGANIDALDWKKVSADAVHDRIMRRLKKERKGIILMHDIQSRTAKALPRLLRSLKDGGYRIVHMVPRGIGAGDGVPALPSETPMLLAKADAAPEKRSRRISRSIIHVDDAATRASVVEAVALVDGIETTRSRSVSVTPPAPAATGTEGSDRRSAAIKTEGWVLRATIDASRWIIR